VRFCAVRAVWMAGSARTMNAAKTLAGPRARSSGLRQTAIYSGIDPVLPEELSERVSYAGKRALLSPRTRAIAAFQRCREMRANVAKQYPGPEMEFMLNDRVATYFPGPGQGNRRSKCLSGCSALWLF